MKTGTVTVGNVLEIQRMSTEDGPGLRTTLFLKGCPLHCAWCHNPESISPDLQLHWSGSRCLRCGLCVAACPEDALSLSGGDMAIDRSSCRSCGACVKECPTASLEMWGGFRNLDEVLGELLRDKAYFGADGGVTVSGGEAALQPAFVNGLFARLHEAGVSTALDTCGMCSGDAFQKAGEYADILLYDLKDSDAGRHKAHIGGDLGVIQDNFRLAVRLVAASMRDGARPKRLWVRTPIIPGMTDSADNVRGIARFLLAEAGDSVERWELCAFNNLCAGKYQSLGKEWQLAGTQLMGAPEMGALAGAAVAEGWPADRIRWTGMTRKES
jgi:pyruvate formate lyase activating enzyme